MHFGKITFGVDERGEVGMLTRNILIQASDDAERSSSAGTSWRWPGPRCMSPASSSIAWVRTCTWPAIRSTGIWSAMARAVHQELRDSRHLQPLRDRAWHQQRARGKQRDLQQHRSLLLPGRRRGDGNQFVHNLGMLTKCHPDATLRPDKPRPVRIGGRQELRYGRPERQGYPDPFRQHGVDFLDHQSGQYLPGQRGRGFRRDRFLVRLAGASDG